MKRKTVIQLATLVLIVSGTQSARAQGVSVTQYDEATSSYEEAYVTLTARSTIASLVTTVRPVTT